MAFALFFLQAFSNSLTLSIFLPQTRFPASGGVRETVTRLPQRYSTLWLAAQCNKQRLLNHQWSLDFSSTVGIWGDQIIGNMAFRL
jgi:hypothetical protein